MPDRLGQLVIPQEGVVRIGGDDRLVHARMVEHVAVGHGDRAGGRRPRQVRTAVGLSVDEHVSPGGGGIELEPLQLHRRRQFAQHRMGRIDRVGERLQVEPVGGTLVVHVPGSQVAQLQLEGERPGTAGLQDE